MTEHEIDNGEAEEAEGLGGRATKGVKMPAPTTYPIITALGAVLLASGLVTTPVFSVAGGIVAVFGLAGWIGELLPGRGSHVEPLVSAERRSLPVHPDVAMPLPAEKVAAYSVFPESVHPVSAGFKGGILGGIVMAAVALLYGVISGRGIWYPINLLAALVLPGYRHATLAGLEAFHLEATVVGVSIHAIVAPSLGLCLGVLYPMLPPKRLFWAGIAGPLLWSGLLYSLMGVLNPALQEWVDWVWFILSQLAYAAVTAIVVERSTKIGVRRASRGGKRGGER